MMRRLGYALAVLLGLGAAIWIGLGPMQRAPAPSAQTGSTVAGELGDADLDGYLRAVEPREFRFPRDHGVHPGFRHEWWYYTGNLTTPEGRRFGFQLTFFRIALAPGVRSGPGEDGSAWRSEAVYMAHFALTDVEAGRFHHAQRFSRNGLALAGAAPGPADPEAPFGVWLEGWKVKALADPRCEPGAGCHAVELVAHEGEIGLRLRLTAAKPPVLQGEGGLSQKSADPGNASYYYSMTRLDAVGEVSLGGEPLAVAGSAWMDREWSTSALGPEQTGWDWFALQLSDGSELMFYRLRLRDGSMDPHSAGVWVDPDGRTQRLEADDVGLEVRDHWTSPRSGIRYPALWTLSLADIELTVAPVLPDQELTETVVRYWEGAVDVSGAVRGREVGGGGYVELAGYGETPLRARQQEGRP